MADDTLKVVQDSLTSEAVLWKRNSVTMARIAQTIAGLTLPPTAFWAGLNSSNRDQLSAAYDAMQTLFTDLTRQGASEFDELSGAMIRARDLYDAADDYSRDELGQIYGESRL